MPRSQKNDNFIDKTFTVVADILLKVFYLIFCLVTPKKLKSDTYVHVHNCTPPWVPHHIPNCLNVFLALKCGVPDPS